MNKVLLINNEEKLVKILSQTKEEISFEYESKKYLFSKNFINQKCISFDSQFVVNGVDLKIEKKSKSRAKKHIQDHGQMISPMPGKILKILLKEGATVMAGASVLVMEAMKMEHTVKASKSGTITKIHYQEGSQVNAGVELVTIC